MLISGIEIKATVLEFYDGGFVGVESIFVGFVESPNTPGFSVIITEDGMGSEGS